MKTRRLMLVSNIAHDRISKSLPKKIDFKKTPEKNHCKLNVNNAIIIPLFVWGLCFFLSALYLLICTKSSPLYPLNDWVDANAFFTMGKGMMNGKILYRDLFEQKGPLLYLIHGFAYLISNTSFLGVYLFEVLSFSVFLFYGFKIVALFVDFKYALVSLPLIATGILNLRSFAHGDSAEEFCLPFITISLYFLLRYFKDIYPGSVPNLWFLYNGILAGCVLWVKFSFLGFWIGWMASFLFCFLLSKHYLLAIKSVLFFISGILIATLPWVFYFGVNNAISAWKNTYFVINLTMYPSSTSFFFIIGNMLSQLAYQALINPAFGGLFWLGIIIFVSYKKFLKSRVNRICLLLSIFLLSLGVYGGGRGNIYYFLIFSPFIVLGFIVLLSLVYENFGVLKSTKITCILLFCALLVTVPLTLRFNQNTYLLKFSREDLVQYKFASIINESENATLLNYGSLDNGFYTVTGITPNIKFFEQQNISYSQFPLNMDEQNRYIKEKSVEYIVLRQEMSSINTLHNIPFLFENYRLIASANQEFENVNYYYALLKIIN